MSSTRPPFVVGDAVKIRHGNGVLVGEVIEIRDDQKAVVAVPSDTGGDDRLFTRALAFLEPVDSTPTPPASV